MSPWAHRIRELARLDSGRRIFGAQGGVPGWGHRYQSRNVSDSDLAAFESWCGGRLPDAYREYLLSVGLGPGPYYGLMPFEKIREELSIIYEDYAEDFGTEGRPCSGFSSEGELTELRARGVGAMGDFAAPRSPGGFMPICYQGCEFVVVMVTSGKLAGSMFTTTNFATAGSRWMAASRPPGIVGYPQPINSLPGFPPWPDFTQWVDGWLEQCFADLNGGAATT